MGIEIEHKYLVKDDSYKELAYDSVEISQCYLCKDPNRTIRIRTWNSRAFLTIKGATIVDSRLEYEYEIPYDEATELLKMGIGNIIRKRRYFINYMDNRWEVDEFLGNLYPLVIAEIELQCSTHDYSLPPFVGQEVTGDTRYYNSNL